MNDLFLILFLVSIAGLIVGLINPSKLKFKSRKQVLLIFGGSIILFLILFGVTSGPSSTPTSKSTEQEAPKEISNSSKTLEEKVTDAINNSLESKTNLGKQRVVGVEVTKYTPQELSTYGYKNGETVIGLLIKINADQNLTTNLTKGTMHNEATKIAQAVFPIDPTVGDIIIWSQLPLVDQYGNTKDETAIVYSMSRSLFDKVNWSDYNHRELPTLLKSENKIDDRNNYFESVTF